MFSIPGFSMFRNFYGQWSFTFSFYYALLFGISFAIILQSLKKSQYMLLSVLFIIFITISARQFISGELVNQELWKSNGKKNFVKIDTSIISALKAVRNLPVDGKLLTLPLTDPGYEMFQGANGGVYQGPSLISYLAGKKDFSGIQEIDPYSGIFLTLAKKNKFDDLLKITSLLNIKYIFYNADPGIYDDFPEFPYDRTKLYLPKQQSEYKNFVDGFQAKRIGKFGKYYSILSIDNTHYLPHIFAASEDIFTNDPVLYATFIKTTDPRVVILTIPQKIQISKITIF